MNLRVWRGGGTGCGAHVKTAGCALVFLLLGNLASAQTVYRWEDERGVVHFSDAPPRDAKNVQTRSMPRAPKPAIRGTEGPSAVADDASTTGDSVQSEKPATADATPSAARIEIKKRDVNPTGEATNEFTGEVENVGGSRANDVIVVIDVTETNQGDHCLREEVDVSPSSLDPGEKGSFSATLSNPCFYGPVATSVQAEWD
jgi:hypothetical protein